MIQFTVYGMPGPQGSKRVAGHMPAKPGRKHGRALLVESSAKVKPWRESVKWAARAAIGSMPPMDGPIAYRMTFTLPKPASAPKKRRIWADRKPDMSKLQRSTEDALTDAGFWADDARVVAGMAFKVYPGEGTRALLSPGCVIEVWTLAEAPEYLQPDPGFFRG